MHEKEHRRAAILRCFAPPLAHEYLRSGAVETVLRYQRGNRTGNLPPTLDRWFDRIGEVGVLIAHGAQIQQRKAMSDRLADDGIVDHRESGGAHPPPSGIRIARVIDAA